LEKIHQRLKYINNKKTHTESSLLSAMQVVSWHSGVEMKPDSKASIIQHQLSWVLLFDDQRSNDMITHRGT